MFHPCFEYCGQDFVSLGRHVWRCKPRVTSSARPPHNTNTHTFAGDTASAYSTVSTPGPSHSFCCVRHLGRCTPVAASARVGGVWRLIIGPASSSIVSSRGGSSTLLTTLHNQRRHRQEIKISPLPSLTPVPNSWTDSSQTQIKTTDNQRSMDWGELFHISRLFLHPIWCVLRTIWTLLFHRSRKLCTITCRIFVASYRSNRTRISSTSTPTTRSRTSNSP